MQTSDGTSPSTAAGGKLAPHTPVTIGFGSDDIAGYLKTAGINVGSTGDMAAQMRAIANDINNHGGLAGRPVRLAEYKFNSSQALANPDAAAVQACTAWTQDDHVTAVVMPDVLNDNMLRCLNKAGVPVVNAGGLANLQTERFYSPTYTQNPAFLNVGNVVGETYDRITIARLIARDFFQPWNTSSGAPGNAPMKLGIIEPNTPNGDLALKSIEAQLSRHGIKAASVFRSSGDTSQAVSESSSIVLQFRSAGVTHVIGNFGVIMMSNAESQSYRPRYLIPGFPALYASTAPAGQLRGAMAEDNLPAIDTDAAQDPGDPSPATGHCKKLMQAASQDSSDRTTLASMLVRCDSLYFLKAAADKAGTLAPGQLLAGFASLGNTARAAATWGSDFSASRHASGSTMRDLDFDATCTCFRFSSKHDYA